MKKCPKCGNEHSKTGTYCSRSCANSRIFTDSAKLKKSVALKGKPSTQTPHDREKAAQKTRETRLRKYLETPFDQLGMENRRRRVFEEQNWCCNKCKISEWQGFKITLELEHKDGDNLNNVRENLEGLCPNCHSITDTWRGRNKSKRSDTITDEFLLQCLRETDTIRLGLLKAGLSAKGGNYKRARRLLEL